MANRDDRIHLLTDHEPDLGDDSDTIRTTATFLIGHQLGLGGVTHTPEEADVD